MSLEWDINQALESSWCTMKDLGWERIILLNGIVRRFVNVVLEFQWAQILWCVDISWDSAPFWSKLLVNRSWYIIEEDPFELGWFLFSRYSQDTNNWIYFPDIPLDICFPIWYKFYSWDDTWIYAINLSWDKLFYSFENIHDYSRYLERLKNIEWEQALNLERIPIIPKRISA